MKNKEGFFLPILSLQKLCNDSHFGEIMNHKIKFGTDGWRAIMGKEFTYENLTRLTFAVSDVLTKLSPEKRTILVGYDRRLLSKQFAQLVATIYAKHNFTVKISESFVPTPAMSWSAKHHADCIGATIITASHNPSIWNGFKFKENFGGSALPKTTHLFEEVANSETLSWESVDEQEFDTSCVDKKIQYFDPYEEYRTSLFDQVEVETIKAEKPKVCIDVMNGSGSHYIKKILEDLNLDTAIINSECNPNFRGLAPEPIRKNLDELSKYVVDNKLIAGFALDGDADRLGAVDEYGEEFSTQQILSVVYWHMTRHRKKKWSIARSVSTTKMVDLIANRNGYDYHETPVGYKYIAEKMLNEGVEIGGEESGGVGIKDHIPERDGLLTILLLLEIISIHKMSLTQIYAQICKEERPYFFKRSDLKLSSEKMDTVMNILKRNPPSRWSSQEVDKIVTIDGFKFYLRDGSWVLIRPSGTEPVFRTYAESDTIEHAANLLCEVEKFAIEG